MFFSLPFLAFFLLYFFAIFQLEGVANSQKKSPLKALQSNFLVLFVAHSAEIVCT